MKKITLYHGSKKYFKSFDLSKVGSNFGTSEGYGIYFTTDKERASGYAQGGFLYECVAILQRKNRKLTRKDIDNIIDLLDEDALSNYGEGLDAYHVIRDALNGDAVSAICELVNSGSLGIEEAANLLIKTTGCNYDISKERLDEYVIWDISTIKINTIKRSKNEN